MATFLRAKDVALLLHVSLRTVWRLTARGELPAPVRMGKVVRWRQEDIDTLVARRSQPKKRVRRNYPA